MRLSKKHKANHLCQASSKITAEKLQHVQNQLFKEYDSNATKSRKVELAAPSGPLQLRFFTEPCWTMPGSTGACSTSWLSISTKMGKWASEAWPFRNKWCTRGSWRNVNWPNSVVAEIKTTVLEQQQSKTCGWFSCSLANPKGSFHAEAELERFLNSGLLIQRAIQDMQGYSKVILKRTNLYQIRHASQGEMTL